MNASHPLLKFIAFALVCLGFSAYIVAVIGNLSLEDRTSYEAEFTDVAGLLVNDDVKISGVTVGKVTGMEVIPGGTALVRFEVDDDVELGEDSRVRVRWRDVFGLRFLYVDPAGDEVVPADHRFPLSQTDAPADLGLLLKRVTPVMTALAPEQQNQVLEALSEALVGRTDEVQDLIREGAELTQAIASRDDELRALIGNAATVVDAYAAREQDLRGLLDSFADVSESVAARNDTLEQAILRLADAQSELGRTVDANDEHLRGALDELDEIVAVLSVNHDNLEDIAETAGRGFVSYHRLSRLGQWFQIRAVGGSLDYETFTSERGAELPERREQAADGGSANSLGPFFTLRGGR
jgi:phospholipid/cholesterol/gamma-HCH transport system substrate-binding protein